MEMDGVITSVFHDQSPCKHQIDSYDWLVNSGIKGVIDTKSLIKEDQRDDVQIEVSYTRVDRPKYEDDSLLPKNARTLGLNYSCEIYVDAKVNIKGQTWIIRDISIGAIPCLVKSSKCNSRIRDDCQFDVGGYFIIDGREKTIISTERAISNQLFVGDSVDTNEGQIVKARCRVISIQDASISTLMQFNLQSKKIKKNISKYVVKGVEATTSQFEFTVQLAGHKKVPLFMLFRALSIESDKAIIGHMFRENELHDQKYRALIHDLVLGTTQRDKPVYTEKDALKGIKNPGDRSDLLSKLVYPNVSSNKEKAILLGIHARKIINKFLDSDKETTWSDNRDNFRRKRVDVCGVILLQVIRKAFDTLRNHVRSKLHKLANIESPYVMDLTVRHLFTRSYLDDFMSSYFKGNWGQLMDQTTSGLVEDLDRLSYTSYISHIRRVKSSVDSALKLTDPHKLGPEQFGYFCPFESPDGANVGLIKHLSSACQITTDSVVSNRELFIHGGAASLKTFDSYSPYSDLTKVFRDNTIIGFHENPIALYGELVRKRRSGDEKFKFVSLYFDVQSNEFHVFTDAGRCIRPLLIVDDLNKTFTKRKLRYGIDYEYVDLCESNYHVIAADVSKRTKYTRYCEISPSMCLGYYMSSVPLLNHNPSARAMLGGQQAKQAIGVYSTHFRERYDTTGYILHYPQKSLITTRHENVIRKASIPNGQNVIMAIAAMGYNQEDAVILNRNSVQRGLFDISVYKTMLHELSSDEESRTLLRNVKFQQEQDTNTFASVKLKFDESGYDKLDSDGLPGMDLYFQEGELVLGCVESRQIGQGDFFDRTSKCVVRDTSIAATSKYHGYVEGRQISDKNVKIKLRQFRQATMGDKVASMHGQKGVVGLLLAQEEMPFTKDGIVPDIVINPYAFPKRMTMGHILECLFGRVAATSGTRVDATAFDQYDFPEMYKYLEQKNMDRSSNELMYNPRTGHQLEAEIFIGPMYYYRLKHMTEDKIQYRSSTGGMDRLTGQPAHGKANKGGLKIGEMEMNAIISHGMSTLLKELTFDKSDGVIREPGATANAKSQHVYVDSAGDVLISNYERKIVATKTVLPDGHAVRLSKTFQLLKHELNGASIDVKIMTREFSFSDEDETYGITEEEEDEAEEVAEEEDYEAAEIENHISPNSEVEDEER